MFFDDDLKNVIYSVFQPERLSEGQCADVNLVSMLFEE